MKDKLTMAFAGALLAMVMTASAYADNGTPTAPEPGPGGFFNFYITHTANNVGSPVTFVVNSSLNVEDGAADVSFGDGSGIGARYNSGAIVAKHTYSAANYAGYFTSGSISYNFIAGENGNTANVMTAIKYVPVWIAGDTNGDGVVDLNDISRVSMRLNTKYGQNNYDDGADLNNDNIVDMKDMKIVRDNFGRRVSE